VLDCEELKDGILILRNCISYEHIAHLRKGAVVDIVKFQEDDESPLHSAYWQMRGQDRNYPINP